MRIFYLAILARVRGYLPFDLLAHYEPDLGSLTATADRLCAEWFGTPPDSEVGCLYLRAPFSALGYSGWKSSYIIFVHRGCRDQGQRAAAIAHETFHRYIHRRDGLHRELWVSEMLGYLASQHVLASTGFESYARQRSAANRRCAAAMDLDQILVARRRLRAFGLLGFGYPRGFCEGVAILGEELRRLVGWPAMCALTSCRGWPEWFGLLREDRRALAREVLPALTY